MADIDLRQAHHTDLEKAKSVIEKIVTKVQTDYPSLVSSIDWNSDQTQATVKGKGFKGEFTVDETEVAIAIDLNMLTRPFKGKVQEKIAEQIKSNFG